MKDINDVALFKAKFVGIPAHKVAMAMTRLQHGIDFARCSKEMMAEAWANRNEQLGHKELAKITLDMIADRINALYAERTTMHVPLPLPAKRPTSREAFETWIGTNHAHMNLTHNLDDNYEDLNVDFLWSAWKAGASYRGW